MKFGNRKSSRPNEIDLTGIAHLGGAREFMRMWSVPSGPVTCIIDPAALGADPALLGVALMDAARHGAKAYAHAVSVSEHHALERILEGFDAEREQPTDTPTQLVGKSRH